MSTPASKQATLSKEDRTRVEKLNHEVQTRLAEIHSIGMRTLGHTAHTATDVADAKIKATFNQPSGGGGVSPQAITVKSIDITLDDGKGNCVRLQDPPGTCSAC